MQIFGGIVHAGNPKLDGTDLDENEYPMLFRKFLFYFLSVVVSYVISAPSLFFGFPFWDVPTNRISIFQNYLLQMALNYSKTRIKGQIMASNLNWNTTIICLL